MRHILHARQLDPDSARRWFRSVRSSGCSSVTIRPPNNAPTNCWPKHDIPFYGQYLRQILLGFRGQWVRSKSSRARSHPGTGQARPRLTLSLLAQSYSRKRLSSSAGVAQRLVPGKLFRNPPEVNPTQLMAAKTGDLLACQQTGRASEAGPLLLRLFFRLGRAHPERTGGRGWSPAMSLPGCMP